MLPGAQPVDTEEPAGFERVEGDLVAQQSGKQVLLPALTPLSHPR